MHTAHTDFGLRLAVHTGHTIFGHLLVSQLPSLGSTSDIPESQDSACVPSAGTSGSNTCPRLHRYTERDLHCRNKAEDPAQLGLVRLVLHTGSTGISQESEIRLWEWEPGLDQRPRV